MPKWFAFLDNIAPTDNFGCMQRNKLWSVKLDVQFNKFSNLVNRRSLKSRQERSFFSNLIQSVSKVFDI